MTFFDVLHFAHIWHCAIAGDWNSPPLNFMRNLQYFWDSENFEDFSLGLFFLQLFHMLRENEQYISTKYINQD